MIYKIKKSKRKICIIISTLIMLVISVYIGPMDGFKHGFFTEPIDCGQIADNDFLDTISLETNDYEMRFMPKKNYLSGFEIYLVNQPDDNRGNITLTILDNKKVIDTIFVDLSKVRDSSWYKVYTSVKLQKNKEYILKISAVDCTTVPQLQKVNRDYLSEESITGNILISYAYAKSTFTFQNKMIIGMFFIAIWMFLCSCFISEKQKNYFRVPARIIFMISVLTWNYMYNSMDNQNTDFSEFQEFSETLVTGTICAEQEGIYFRDSNERGFGLGRYNNLKSSFMSYSSSYITDEYWINGYSKTESAIIVNSNIYSKEVAIVGNYIEFANGECYRIKQVEDNGANIYIYLNCKEVLSYAKNGSLDDAVFYDSNKIRFPISRITAYKSQYGLQGKVFRHLARHMDRDQAISNLHLLCCIATAVVLVVIVILISAKYNKILAGVFYVTFLLSPWIVNFARNLYWVEFTWFIPMAVGLFCAWKIENRKCRIICYILTLIAITGKCLCGYEYISCIMMGLIVFLLTDFILALLQKNKKQVMLLFRTIVMIGSIALIGFAAAICIHALLRGNGNMVEGIINIFEQDVLRRTYGTDLNVFDAVLWDSLNASAWEVYCRYFRFSTQIITGINGNLFPLICTIPLCILGYEFRRGKMNIELLIMYILFFLTSISWFLLGKSHSYIHTGMNYVLWYFGYVQICFYIMLNKLNEVYKNLCKEKMMEESGPGKDKGVVIEDLKREKDYKEIVR